MEKVEKQEPKHCYFNNLSEVAKSLSTKIASQISSMKAKNELIHF